MICTKCQHANRDGSQFCSSCGAPLKPDPKPLPSAVTQQLMESSTFRIEQPAPEAGTRPLDNPRGFVQRPFGAVFGSRFKMLSIEMIGSDEIQYIVREKGNAAQRTIRKCSNPKCGFMDAEGSTHCVACGQPNLPDAPQLRLIESALPIRPEQAALIALAPVHSAIRPPILTFSESLGGKTRYCLVIPAVQELPNLKDKQFVPNWVAGLAPALDVLFEMGVSFNGSLKESAVGLDGDAAVWMDFRGWKVMDTPVSADERRRCLRQLGLMVYTWMSNKADFSGADASLSAPMSAFFNQALLGEGFTSGNVFTKAFSGAVAESAALRPVSFNLGRLSDVGKTRQLNEDSLFAVDLTRSKLSVNHPVAIMVVADGMGGHAAGEVASGMIVDFIAQKAAAELGSAAGLAGGRDWQEWLKQVVLATNQALLEQRQQMGTDMGSTLVMAVMDGCKAYLAHVGDSRIYLVNADGAKPLTNDHSLVGKLVSSGMITPAEVRTHPQRNIVLRTMGDKAQLEVETSVHTLKPGDRLLLCSDGLWEMVEETELQKIVMSAASPQEACVRAVDAANAHGGEDNISVIILEIVAA